MSKTIYERTVFLLITMFCFRLHPLRALLENDWSILFDSNDYPSAYFVESLFLPIAYLEPVPEVDLPHCRWGYDGENDVNVSYQWGDRLQVSGSSWRTAFETAFELWNKTATNTHFHYSNVSANDVNTYDLEDGYRGYTNIFCSLSSSTTNRVEIRGNVYYDVEDSYTTAHRQGIAAHEVGHATSIGHIPNSYPRQAVMNMVRSLYITGVINILQSADIDLSIRSIHKTSRL